MIDKLTTFTLNLIKSNVSIVLVFYASGFLSFIAYYRVLGIPYIGGDLQTYAELAGKNLIVILQTFIFLITKPDYFITNINSLNWTGNAIYLWSTTVFILTLILLIFKLFSQKAIITAIQQNNYIQKLQLFLIVVIVVTNLHIETQSFHAENVLQAANINKLYQKKLNLVNYEKNNPIDYEKRLKTFNYSNEIESYLFTTPQGYDETGNDKRRLDSFMLIIIMTSITAMGLYLYNQHTLIKSLAFLFALSQSILIPFNYGVLGVKYQYPVVSMDAKKENGIIHKDAVFLIAKSHNNLVIYDRLNFFQISYIPESSIINIEQIFTGSPFSNCSNGGFKPCEIYAIKP